MKRTLALFVISLTILSATAQQKKQPPKPVTPDINQMMQDAMKASGMSQEERDQVNKLMGDAMKPQKVPTVNVPVSPSGTIPSRDESRIAAARHVDLRTVAQVQEFVTEVHKAVTNRLDPSVSAMGKGLLAKFPAAYHASDSLSVAATGCWLAGYPTLGLWIMGEACLAGPGDANTLNNYAAMLVMCGGEQAAIPILNTLNARYPNNYSVMNNLGQAWFGLGDLATAEKYLDSAIRRFPACSQALQTKAEIQGSKGNKTGTATLLQQAIRSAYTTQREDALRKLGKTIALGDLSWTSPKSPDPLGLEKFVLPPFPRKVSECESLKKSWDEFHNTLNALSARCGRQLDAGMEANSELMLKQKAAALQVLSYDEAGRLGMVLPFANKVKPFMADLDDRLHRQPIFGTTLWAKAYDKVAAEAKALEDKKTKALVTAEKGCTRKMGEGESVDQGCYCPKATAIMDEYVSGVSTLLGAFVSEVVEPNRRYFNDYAYYSQYTSNDAMMMARKAEAQMKYLAVLSSINPEFPEVPCSGVIPKGSDGKVLLDFDSLRCTTSSQFRVPGIGKITLRCNYMTTELAPVFIPFKAKYTENWWTGQITNASVSVSKEVAKGIKVSLGVEGNFNGEGFVDGSITAGVEGANVKGEVESKFDKDGFVKSTVKVGGNVDVSKDFGKDGPLEVDVKGTGEGGIKIEVDKTGISDVSLTGDVKLGGEATGSVGTKGESGSGSVKGSGSYGWNAGGELGGKSTLSGLTIAKF